MKYADPKLRSALAAEYVLGTLTGAARRRFERLCAVADGAMLLAERYFWEQRLAGLASMLEPVTPPETVWIGLERSIGTAAGSVVPLQRPAARRSAGDKFIRGWAILATAASVVLAVLLVRVQERPAAPAVQQQAAVAMPYVAALDMPKAPMHFTLALSPERGLMKVAASGSYPDLGSHSLQLWWISSKGPVSLGVLPTSGEASMPLPKGLPTSDAKLTLAVSLEPIGGSPTGLPTGPVLVSGPALRSI